MKIEIYSDLICPWCYIGKRRMQSGLKLLGKEFAPKIVWRPFQLNPDMPIEGMSRKNYRIKKFGSWERSMAMDAEVAAIGKSLGIEFNYDKVLMTPYTGRASAVMVGRTTESSGSSIRSTLQGLFHRQSIG